MDEAVLCIGCGAPLQAEDPRKLGYLPASALKKVEAETNNSTVYCQRCFRLRHYNEVTPEGINHDKFLALLNSLADKKALVVNVVDLFDFSNSLLEPLKRFIGTNDFILVGNKIDLFPKNSRQSKIKDWMRQEANRVGLYPKKIFLVSAARQKQLAPLTNYLKEAAKDRDLYFVGTTNVGKSTLINALIAQNSELKNLITTSRYPGTTLGEIKIPLDTGHFLVDTPGVFNQQQLALHLKAEDLAVISPKKSLKPITYQLRAGNTIFLGGVGRLDYLKGPATSFTVYAARSLFLHRCKTDLADRYYRQHCGKELVPPQMGEKIAALKGQAFHSTFKSDLLFGGIGFVTIPKGCLVRSYTPAGIGLGIRRALI